MQDDRTGKLGDIIADSGVDPDEAAAKRKQLMEYLRYQQEKSASVPKAAGETPEFFQKNMAANEASKMEQVAASRGTARMQAPALADDVAKDIDLGAYRKSKALEQAAASSSPSFLSKAAGAVEETVDPGMFRNAKKFGKVLGTLGKVSKAIPYVGPLVDLAMTPEANAGSDQIPGRKSFDEIYGKLKNGRK